MSSSTQRTIILSRIPVSILHCAILTAITLIIYASVVTFGVIEVWDDSYHFLNRDLILNWPSASWLDRVTTPDIGYPIPLPTFLYFCLYQLPEAWVQPATHALILLLHLLNVWLIYFLTRAWLPAKNAALVIALVWCTHPVLAETVGWITNLKSVGVSTMLLAMMLTWQSHLQKPNPKKLLLTALFTLLAFGFKPFALISFPLLVTQAIRHDFQSLKTRGNSIFLALTGGLSFIYWFLSRYQHKQIVLDSAGYDPYDVELLQQLERIGGAFFVEITNVISPLNLHPLYFHSTVSAFQVFLGWTFIFTLLAATLFFLIKKHPAVWGFIFFWITYLPVSGIEFMPRFAADTFMYLPTFGLLLALCSIARPFARESRPQLQSFLKAGLAILLIAMTLLSFVQAQRWQNSSTLLIPVVEAFPDHYLANKMVGDIYMGAEQYEEAIAYYQHGLRHIKDGEPLSVALPVALESVGRFDEAYDVAMKLWRYPGVRPPNIDEYIVSLHFRHRLTIPTDAELRKAIEQAIYKSLKTQHGPEVPWREFAQYFQEQGLEEAAKASSKRADEMNHE